MKFLERLIKNNILMQKIYIFFGTIFFRFIGLFVRVKKNVILFSSMSGKNYEYSSPYYIYLKIFEKYGNEYEYIWAFSKSQKANKYQGKRVKIDTFKYFLTVLKAGIWITDVNIERGLRLKRKKQYYVNTWHGSVIKSYPKKRKDYNLNNVDIFCSDGSYYDAFFFKYYRVNKKALLHCGRPREDNIFDCEENRDKLRQELGIKNDEFVLLYMPTWRESGVTPYFDVNYVLEHTTNVKLIFHAHNLDESNFKFSNQILNLSGEKNLNKLYAISDLMISDYSSCIYDFLLLHKPVILFTKDYDDYCSNRGLEIDFKKEFPNSIVTNERDLVNLISQLKSNKQEEQFLSFLNKIVQFQDRKIKATDAIINKMIEDGVLTS